MLFKASIKKIDPPEFEMTMGNSFLEIKDEANIF